MHVELSGPLGVEADTAVEYGTERLVRSGPPALWLSSGWGASSRHVRLRYAEGRDHAEFVVGPGARHVRATWSPGVRVQDVTTTLLGPVIACVLRLQGALCLHAAVVEIGERAVALAGVTRAGKSTTAAGLVRRGGRLIADDVAAVAWDGSCVRVHYGPASMHLDPEVAERVLDPSSPLQPLWSHALPSKGLLAIERDDRSSRETGVPLAGVYVLTPRGASAPGVETIPARDAQPALAGHTSVRWVLDAAGRAAEFLALRRLTSAVPVRRVHRPDALHRLDDVCTAILEDLARPQSRRSAALHDIAG